jgi:hypothetical protein
MTILEDRMRRLREIEEQINMANEAHTERTLEKNKANVAKWYMQRCEGYPVGPLDYFLECNQWLRSKVSDERLEDLMNEWLCSNSSLGLSS